MAFILSLNETNSSTRANDTCGGVITEMLNLSFFGAVSLYIFNDLNVLAPKISGVVGFIGTTGRSLLRYHCNTLKPNFDGLVDAPQTMKDVFCRELKNFGMFLKEAIDVKK